MPVPHSSPWPRLQSPLSGRVESWRGSHRGGESQLAGGFRHLPVPQSALNSVSSFRHVVRSMRISRTTHSCPLHAKGYATYQTGSAFNRSCLGRWTR